MKKVETKENPFLEEQKIHEFMELINNNEMFTNRSDLLLLYNLICTFKDRMFSAVDYLNKHCNCPTTEEDFVVFLVYACMVYDGFNKMHENLLHQVPPYKGKKKYFKHAKHYKEYYFNGDTCPSDDVFFEYLRAMAFAHPYEVSYRGRPFLEKNEKHYCPWVVVNNIMSFDDIKDSVGIRMYTNIDQNKIVSLTFSFKSLKGYIKSIYDTFPALIKWAKDVISGQNAEWKLTKVNRKQDAVSVLNEVKSILESRFADAYSIDKAISYLTCATTIASNSNSVELFRKRIIECIPAVCDSVDALDYEKMEDALSIIYARPDKMHQMAHYQLEKIYSYLDERSDYIDPASNEYWGLQQAYAFSQEFAKNWVTIDVRTMQYDEIKLLVAVACYLEKEKQDKAKEQ